VGATCDIRGINSGITERNRSSEAGHIALNLSQRNLTSPENTISNKLSNIRSDERKEKDKKCWYNEGRIWGPP